MLFCLTIGDNILVIMAFFQQILVSYTTGISKRYACNKYKTLTFINQLRVFLFFNGRLCPILFIFYCW